MSPSTPTFQNKMGISSTVHSSLTFQQLERRELLNNCNYQVSFYTATDLATTDAAATPASTLAAAPAATNATLLLLLLVFLFLFLLHLLPLVLDVVFSLSLLVLLNLYIYLSFKVINRVIKQEIPIYDRFNLMHYFALIVKASNCYRIKIIKNYIYSDFLDK